MKQAYRNQQKAKILSEFLDLDVGYQIRRMADAILDLRFALQDVQALADGITAESAESRLEECGRVAHRALHPEGA